MSAQRLNGSLSSLPRSANGEELDFELESFEQNVDKNLLPSSNTELIDVEGQRPDQAAQSKSRELKKYAKLAIFVLTWTIATIFITRLAQKVKIKRQTRIEGQLTVNEEGFTIDEILNGNFAYHDDIFEFINPPESVLFTPNMDPGLYYSTEKTEGIVKLVARQVYDKNFNSEMVPMVFNFDGMDYEVELFEVDYFLNYAIIGTNIEKEFRHSSHGNYWLYDIKLKTFKPIKTESTDGTFQELAYCHFSPNYNFIYLVYANELYVQNLQSGSSPVKISPDGKPDTFNGKADWVYEEEIFGDDVAVWWAPDDSKLVFAQIDDTAVPDYEFPTYVNNLQSSKIKSIKYPRPGQAIPRIKLFYYEINSGIISELSMGTSKDDKLLYYAKWISSDEFLFKETDRQSKCQSTKIFDRKQNSLEEIRVLNSTTFNGWIERSKDILRVQSNDETGNVLNGFVDILPDEEGFEQIFFFRTARDRNPLQLTKGAWEVNNLACYDQENGQIFYHSNEVHPMSQHLYSVSLSGEALTLQDPNSIDFFSYTMSKSCRYSKKQYLGPDIPHSIVGITPEILGLNEDKKSIHKLLTKDDSLKDAMKKYEYPSFLFKEMVLDGVSLNYIEIRPINFDKSKKYPILVDIYGGPGSQTFTAKFSPSLDESIVSSLNAIVLRIEPRGTGGKGWNFRKWAKDNIGYWEPRDVVAVTAKFIQENKEFIDEDRVAIWGWSYGGFSTLKTLEYDGGKIFKYGLAVAPVTNWKYYDSVYTERYIGIPENSNEYQGESFAINDITAFRSVKRFLIMHGTADDNVHIQNTYSFIDALNVNNIRNYDLQIFPDSAHSISYHNAQRIVYEKLYFWTKDAFFGKFDFLE